MDKQVIDQVLNLNSIQEELNNRINTFVMSNINKIIGEILNNGGSNVECDDEKEYIFHISIPHTTCILNGEAISVYELKFNFITLELFVISSETETEFINISSISQLEIINAIMCENSMF